MTRTLGLAFTALMAACAAHGKAPLGDEDFASLVHGDDKADEDAPGISVEGTLGYQQASAPVHVSAGPRFHALAFDGNAHDLVDVWVRSTDGDAAAWVLDVGYQVLASNDDADGTTDAHVTVELPVSNSTTHYVVFRDASFGEADFTVELGGTPAVDTSCAVDADCVAVAVGGCCPDGRHTAVNASATEEYAAVNACTEPPHLCPRHVIADNRVPACNTTTHLCQMVAP